MLRNYTKKTMSKSDLLNQPDLISKAIGSENPHLMIDKLLAHGADKNIESHSGVTAKRLSGRNWLPAQKEEIDKLLSESVSDLINTPDANGLYPIHKAIHTGKPSMVEKLLKAGANPNQKFGEAEESPLHYLLGKYNHRFSEGNDTQMMKHLIAHGADINDQSGGAWGPLHLAVYNMLPSQVHTLLNAGANPNVKDTLKDTPLHYAIRLRLAHPASRDMVIRSLVNHGADVHAAGHHGKTPMSLLNPRDILDVDAHRYIERHLKEKSEEKLSEAIDINAADDEYGYTPLHLAVHHGHIGMVEKLLKHGADIHVISKNIGNTPLHVAAYKGNLSIVKLLLDHGADKSRRNHKGQKPINFAMQDTDDSFEIARLLHVKTPPKAVSEAINPEALNAQDDVGMTALHLAVQNNNLAMVEKLLKAGANPNTETGFCQDTPLHYANLKEMHNLLIKHGAIPKENYFGQLPPHAQPKTTEIKEATSELDIVNIMLVECGFEPVRLS